MSGARTTQTGIRVTLCATCDRRHPVTRPHCTGCGTASLFLNGHGRCLSCIARGESGEETR